MLVSELWNTSNADDGLPDKVSLQILSSQSFEQEADVCIHLYWLIRHFRWLGKTDYVSSCVCSSVLVSFPLRMIDSKWGVPPYIPGERANLPAHTEVQEEEAGCFLPGSTDSFTFISNCFNPQYPTVTQQIRQLHNYRQTHWKQQ